jgi:hypothetical protein
MTTEPNRLERRGAQRFEAHIPVTLHYEGRTVPGFVQDLSGRGIFFFADLALPAGAVVDLTFTMPSEVTLADDMRVRCRGRVLRTAAARNSQQSGIAVQFASYDYLPAEKPLEEFAGVSAVATNETRPSLMPR